MKRIILYIVLLMPAVTFAQNGKFLLKATLADNGTLVKATLARGDAPSETVQIKNGKFEFSGTLEDPFKTTLSIERKVQGKMKIELYWLYLEPGTIVLNSPNDSLTYAKITGSKLNTDYKKLQAALKPIEARKNNLKAKQRSMSETDRKNELLLAEIAKEEESIEKQFSQVYYQFYKENPDSFLSLEALNKYVGMIPDYRTTKPLFDKLSATVKATRAGKQMAEQLANLKKTDIGTVAPDFTQLDVEGKPVKLSDYKGKYVLVDFWASWCGPCRAENPNVLKAYHRFHAKGLEILGVSLDIEYFKKSWIAAINQDQLPWKQVSDLKLPNEAARIYGINAIPQNVLVGPDGRVVAKNLMGEDLHIKLAEIFGKDS